MPTVARLSVTPVKSMALSHPDRVTLSPAGLDENRRFFLVDADDGLFNGSDAGRLMQVQPRYDAVAEHLSLRFPDGTVVEGDATATGDPIVVGFYGRDVASHLVEGPFAEAVSRFLDEPVRLARCDRPGDGVDVHPLTLVSFASVADLARRAGHDGQLDGRRFRMNLDLDDCEPFEEDTWEGRTIHIGEPGVGAELRVLEKVPRCVVTTLDPDTGEKDFDTLKQIAAFRPVVDGGLPFGMYAEVATPGEIALGDAVAPIEV